MELALLGLNNKECAARLPPEPVLNNLLRYQTTLERQLDKALTRLNNLQQRRRTEATASAREAATEQPTPAPVPRDHLSTKGPAQDPHSSRDFAKRTHGELVSRCIAIDAVRIAAAGECAAPVACSCPRGPWLGCCQDCWNRNLGWLFVKTH